MSRRTISKGAGRLWERNINDNFAELYLGMGTTLSAGSSTTALNNGEAFTSDWIDVSQFDSVIIAIKTDQNGTFSAQFSPDGSNVDSTLTRYYRTAQIEAPHRFTVTRQYFRVVFTNDSGSNQTYFRLQTLAGDKTALNAPMDGTLAQDFDATVVRPTNADDEIVLGRRQGYSAILKFGYNDDVDTGGAEVVAAQGGTFTPLSSATTLNVVSDSTNDDGDPAGTGARTLLISGLDGSRAEQTEVVTMNGTTTVTTSGSWLGINRVVVLSAGAGQGNAGNITVTATTGGTTQAYIPAGSSTTQQVIFHTPAGHNALVRRISTNILKLSGGTSPRCTVTFKVWNPGTTNAIYAVRRFQIDTSVVNFMVKEFTPALILNPTDVAWLECTTNTNNTAVDAEMDLIQVRQAAT